MITVYVLKCNHNKYYVGKTRRDVQTRFQEHFDTSSGSEWTRRYSPIKIVETFEQVNNNFLELTKTLEYMERYGIDNVRGGPYCQVDLSEDLKEFIRKQLNYDSCYKCGILGHFADECDRDDSSSSDYDCGSSSSSHISDERDDFNDRNDYNSRGTRGTSNFVNRQCYTCGSPNHLANECNDTKCYICDSPNHLANECEHNDYKCFKCGSPSHFSNECDY